jgi:hypothetical protein
MSKELDELDQAIDCCRAALTQEDFHVLCKELRHLELIHRKMHRLRTLGRLKIGLLMMDLEEREPQERRQLKKEVTSVFDVDSFAPFDLRGLMLQQLSKERLGKGESLALVVGEGLIEFDRSVREYLKALGWADRGSRWPDYLYELTWLRSKVLLDYLQPASEGLKPGEELLAREVLYIVEKDQESHGSKKLRDDLKDMTPPLIWGEVVYHFLRDPGTIKGERGRTLQEFLSLFRKRYCIECDELFTGPKSSPRLVCQRCSNKLKKRTERERKK